MNEMWCNLEEDRNKISYADAVSKGLCFAMESNEKITVMGIGTQYPSGIFGTTNEAFERFGPTRVLDVPAMENGLTGIAVGLATEGFRPLIVHARVDFMFLSVDPIMNLISKWKYMFGGNSGSCPVVIRAIIGRGWGQGATHSQAFHSALGNVPGLRILMPYSVQDARDMLCQSLFDEIPSIIFEHRSLYSSQGVIENNSSQALTNLTLPRRVQYGTDITLAGYSFAVHELFQVAQVLRTESISSDVIDLRSLYKLDLSILAESVSRTKFLLLHDVGWKNFGAPCEIIARLAEMGALEGVRVRRICLPSTPAPASQFLEQFFYPTIESIASEALEFLGIDQSTIKLKDSNDSSREFIGPY